MLLFEEDNLDYLIPICEYICKDADVELVLINSEQMQELNQRTRGVNKSTDVLSFPSDNQFLKTNFLGSIAINIDLAQQMSAKLNHLLEHEISLLFIHAALHLLGFDHEVDQGEHRLKERELIKHFNLPLSLIDRTLQD